METNTRIRTPYTRRTSPKVWIPWQLVVATITVAVGMVILVSQPTLAFKKYYHGNECDNSTPRWETFYKCLRTFEKVIQKYDIKKPHLPERKWEAICKSHRALMECRDREILQCDALMSRFEERLAADIGWHHFYITHTCDTYWTEIERRRVKKNGKNSAAGKHDYDKHESMIRMCNDRFVDLLNETRAKGKPRTDICGQWLTVQRCHRDEPGECWPLIQMAEAYKQGPNSIYREMDGICEDPTTRLPPPDELRRQERLRRRREIREHLDRKKEEEQVKAKEPWVTWATIGKVALVVAVSLSPLLLVGGVLYFSLKDVWQEDAKHHAS